MEISCPNGTLSSYFSVPAQADIYSAYSYTDSIKSCFSCLSCMGEIV